ncbi:MAG: NHL repeat-containing protein [Coriobacteriia bacterium]
MSSGSASTETVLHRLPRGFVRASLRVAVFLLAMVAAFAPSVASAAYVPELVWGGTGSAPGQFNGASYITHDSSGRLYVSDTNNARIQVFDSDGTFVRSFPTSGGPIGYYYMGPRDIVWHPNGLLYVALSDSDNYKVVAYTTTGEIVRSWSTPRSATNFSMEWPGLAVGPDGSIYTVQDADGLRKYSPEGVLLDSYTGVDYPPSPTVVLRSYFGWTGFNVPNCAVVATNGTIYVSESGRIPYFTPPLRHYFSFGRSTPRRRGMALDADGNLFVAEPGASTETSGVVRYAAGTLRSGNTGPVECLGVNGTDGLLGQVWWPTDVDVVGDYVFIVDGGNRIQRFRKINSRPDNTPPVSRSEVTTRVGSATIRLTSADGAEGSGVAQLNWRLDTFTEQTTTSASVEVATGIGNHVLRYWAADFARNVESEHTVRFSVEATPPPPQWYDTGIQLTAPVTSVIGGTGVTLTAILRGYFPGGGSSIGTYVFPLPGKPIRFERYVPGTGWVTVGTTTTGGGGQAVRTMPAITRPTNYRARFLGGYPYRDVISRSVSIGIRDNLTAPSVPGAVYGGQIFLATGYISPRHAVGRRTVNFRFFHYEWNGWVLRGTVPATTYYYSGTWTRFAARCWVRGTGRWYVAADHAEAGHAYSISRPTFFNCY